MIDFVVNGDLVKLNKEFGFSKFVNFKIHKIENNEDLRKIRGEFNIVEPNENTLRRCFESKNVNLILGIEKIDSKDGLHQRNSGLNQVLCKLAKKNKISLGFSFLDILNSRNQGRLMGRMMQNIGLCKKYKVNMVFGSFAKEVYDLRARKDLEVFARLLGMSKLENTKVFKLKEFSDIKVID